MPLYLVRWPRLEASIVRAKDEYHLTELLEEVGSPADATWTEYDGPLWVDIRLGLEAELSEDEREWSVRGAKTAAAEPWLGAKVETGESETADEMIGAVLAGAFPSLTKVVQEADEEQLDPKKVRAAALRDLEEHAPGGVLALERRAKRAGR